MFGELDLDKLPSREGYKHPEGQFDFIITSVDIKDLVFKGETESCVEVKYKSEKGPHQDLFRLKSPNLDARRISLESFAELMYAACVQKFANVEDKNGMKAELMSGFGGKPVKLKIKHRSYDGKTISQTSGYSRIDGSTKQSAQKKSSATSETSF